MSKNCKSCEFFGGKIKRKPFEDLVCLHPIYKALTGGWISGIKTSCVLYEKKKRKVE